MYKVKREVESFVDLCGRASEEDQFIDFSQSCFQPLISVHLLRGQLVPPHSFWDWMGKIQGSKDLMRSPIIYGI